MGQRFDQRGGKHAHVRTTGTVTTNSKTDGNTIGIQGRKRADHDEIRVRDFTGLRLYRSQPESGCQRERVPERGATPDDHQSLHLRPTRVLHQHQPERKRFGGEILGIL